MDGEDFQLSPICPEETPCESVAMGFTQQTFSNIASLFQPLKPPPAANFQPDSSSGNGKQRAAAGTMDAWPNILYPNPWTGAPYHNPTNTPLSSMGGHQNLQWPPDPPINYSNGRTGLMDSLAENSSCHDISSNPILLHNQR